VAASSASTAPEHLTGILDRGDDVALLSPRFDVGGEEAPGPERRPRLLYDDPLDGLHDDLLAGGRPQHLEEREVRAKIAGMLKADRTRSVEEILRGLGVAGAADGEPEAAKAGGGDEGAHRRGKAVGDFDEESGASTQQNGVDRFIDDFIDRFSPRSYLDAQENLIEILKLKDMKKDKVSSCGGVISVAEGAEEVISTPGFPDSYPANTRCTWTLVAQLGGDNSQLRISTDDFELESSGCKYDSLSVTDPAAGISEVFCGKRGPRDFLSFGNSLSLTFVSDDSENKRGFRLTVSGVKATCGGVYDISGEEPLLLSTPNYPLAYPPDTKCHWLVLSRALVGVELLSYYISPGSQDLLQISTEGFSDLQTYNTRKVYVSKVMSLSFTANPHLAKSFPEPGVQLRVFPINETNECNRTVAVSLDSSAVITSNQYPNGYDNFLYCFWKIKFNISDGYIGRLKFADFDIEEQSDCEYDYLRISDEAQGKDQRYCGFKRALVHKTYSEEVEMSFKSDESNLIFYKGFSVYVSLEKIRVDECTLEKTERGTWVLKSPYLPYAFPAYSVCNVNLYSERTDRFKIRFSKFLLQKREVCTKGDYLSVKDEVINRTEVFCGDLQGYSYITAGNNLSFAFSSDSSNVAEGFELEIQRMMDGNCGGNFMLNPGASLDLRAPGNKEKDGECVWVFQGNNSVLMLDFNKVENVRVSSTGMYTNLFDYNERTLDFIDPSESYMVLSRERGVKIKVRAYEPFYDCGSVLELGADPILIDNLGVLDCSVQVRRAGDGEDDNRAISFSLLSMSHSSACAVRLFDAEAGRSDRLCEDDWRQNYITSSETVNVTAIIPRNRGENEFMLLVQPLQFTCGSTYEVTDRKIIIRNRDLVRGETCVYRFKSNNERIVLDVASGNRRHLSLISASTEGTFQTLKPLSSYSTTSLETNKEFLVVIDPLPRKASLVIQVMREAKVNNMCNTCLVLNSGSSGVVKSPTTAGLTTYPSGLSCDVKFEAEKEQQTVVLTINSLDIPKNTSVDRLSIIKGDSETVIDPSRFPIKPFTLMEETPFSLRFLTSSDNEYEGYEIAYNVYECGGIVTLRNEDKISIRSPGSELYPTYTRCMWFIKTQMASFSDRITVRVVDFDVHASDRLEFFDPLYSPSAVASLTGTVKDRTVVSTGNELMVVFDSDSRAVSSGFELRVGSLRSSCGADIDTATAEEGAFSTLQYFPNTDYCLFRLRPSDGRVMSLTQADWGVPLEVSDRGEPFRVPRSRRDAPGCESGTVFISNTGFLNGSQQFCVEERVPDVMSVHDLLVAVLGSALPPASFRFRAGGCVRELAVGEAPVGSLSSPSFPDYFAGPVACNWTTRSPLLLRVTFLDLDPELDRLVLSDPAHATNLTGAQFPRYVLLEGPSAISFSGLSSGVRKGFSLEYEAVDSRGEWRVSEGHPAVILGRPGSDDRPSAWRVRGPAGIRGLTVLVWATYIPSDPECATHFLQVAGGVDEGVRICGGAGLKTVHVLGEEAVLVLHSSSALAVLAASVHVML
ncbi:cubilin-like, partial [Penaeus vannamei]|uniref:cubilin-like n=1 Tax=Penaeus vannamei TaxID=6689 RepID=UPI00387F6A60